MKKKNKEKGFSLKEQYLKSFAFLKKSQYFIYSIIAIFFIFVLIGFFIPVPENFSNILLEHLQELIKQTEGMGAFELIKFIFIHNVQSSFYGMVFGVFLGVFSVFVAIFNGYILGFVASIIVQSEGFSILWRLLPHGVFELPAIFISLGLGLKLGSFVFQKNKLDSFKEFLFNSLRVFILVVVPLLVLAGIIEGSLMAFF